MRPAYTRAFCAPRLRIARIRVLRCSAARAHSGHLAARSRGAIPQQPPRAPRARKSSRSGQLSGRDELPGDEVVESVIEATPSLTEPTPGGDVRWQALIKERQAGCEDAAVCLGEQDGDPPP